MAETFAIDQKTIEQLVLNAVQDNILSAVENIAQDPVWLARIEQLINQTITHQTVAQIGSIDINTIIRDRVDENMTKFHTKMREDFSSVGINDQATQTQLTIMDDHTVFENNLTAKDLTIANSAVIQNLVVTGSINTDNQSWQGLSADITEKTLKKLTKEWRDQLIVEMSDQIKEQGIDFSHVTIDGETIISGTQLGNTITESNLQSVGNLRQLRVSGTTQLADTVTVINKRVGVNTEEPESALTIWDEEVAVNIGKSKLNQAYIGTSRLQSLSIGTNRISHIDIDAAGMTQIKKLRIGVYQISHADMVPGWSGTRGDLVFNTNIKEDRVFAWVCLGNFKWQPLKSAE
jgi:hypothetical protein